MAVAKEKAEKIDVKMSISFVDSGVNQVVFVRMDGTWL
ncbi:heme-binding protein [Pareuzebyella sediminis]|nr:heme-binding protein [Pareuzebyella sediminis]